MEHNFIGERFLYELLQSYQRDKEPFITDTTIKFPKRTSGFEEFDMLRELFFPNYWGDGEFIKTGNASELERKISELATIFCNGISPYAGGEESIVSAIVAEVIRQLLDVREKLKKDVEAAYKGDPAARSYTQIIRSYPGLNAVLVQRVAHALYEIRVLVGSQRRSSRKTSVSALTFSAIIR